MGLQPTKTTHPLLSLSASSPSSFSFGISSLKMFIESFKVESPNVTYTDHEIQSVYSYETTELVHVNRNGTYEWVLKPKTVKYEFKTDIHVPKLGYNINQRFYSYLHTLITFLLCSSLLMQLCCFSVMLVGWGGNNGATLTAGVIANREWVLLDLLILHMYVLL